MNRVDSLSIQRGFTLIEFMIVLVLVGLLLAATVIQFGDANHDRIDTQAVADLKKVINQVRMQKDPASAYAGMDEIHVATSSGFPSHLCKSGNCANGIYSSAFGDIYTILPYFKGFYITIGPVSATDCVEIGSKMIFSVDRIVVNASVVHSGFLVLRSSVLTTTTTKPARDYFYSTTATTGACRYYNNYMHFDVDYL